MRGSASSSKSGRKWCLDTITSWFWNRNSARPDLDDLYHGIGKGNATWKFCFVISNLHDKPRLHQAADLKYVRTNCGRTGNSPLTGIDNFGTAVVVWSSCETFVGWISRCDIRPWWFWFQHLQVATHKKCADLSTQTKNPFKLICVG